MAKKTIKCPSCGAKNADGTLRCRICTAYVVPGGAKAAAELEKKRAEEAAAGPAPGAEGAVPPAATSFSGTFNAEPKGALSSRLAGIKPARLSGPRAAPGPAPKEESFDLSGLEIDSSSPIVARPSAPAPPPPPPEDAGFDPGSLEIDRSSPIARGPAGPSEPPPADGPLFDPGALEIDSARAPRPGGAAPPPLVADETFDPDGLALDDPEARGPG